MSEMKRERETDEQLHERFGRGLRRLQAEAERRREAENSNLQFWLRAGGERQHEELERQGKL